MKKLVKVLALLVLAAALPFVCGAESQDVSALKVSMPSGAPSLALATLARENPANYTTVAAEAITAEFASAEADFIIAPLNAGAKLYRAGKSTYKLAAVVTWGNLYFASQKENFALEDLNSAAVTLFGEGTISASVALYALEANGVTPGSVEYLAGAANTQSLLLSDENAIVLTAEPALTAAKIKNEKISAVSLNALWQAATGYEGFAQAGLFVKAALIESQPGLVDAYLKMAAESCRKCEEDLPAVAEAAVALEILPNAKVAMSAIPNCAIRFVGALEAREQIEATARIDVKQYGGEVPADDFYYDGAK